MLPMSDAPSPSAAQTRGLAAVVFTDVVGYSSRMQRNEAATIALVQTDFDRMRALCAHNGGEVLNTMGDGMMLCFPSAVQAVSCALQIQGEFMARKAALPEEQALEHRIGVHLGDVFRSEAGTVAGDGVNIAARLEAKAPFGGICLSQTVYDTVKGKVPMQARFAGPESLKNIAEPILTWHVMPEGGPGFAAAKPATASGRGPRYRSKRWLGAAVSGVLVLAIAGSWYWTRRDVSVDRVAAKAEVTPGDNRSIAVLPFTNMSDDKNTAYFADGVHEDLLTQLASIGELKVVSRTSVMDYRNTAKNVRQIGTELNVGSLVEGSVRRAGDNVRVTAQLIDTRADKHLWAKSYDRGLKDIFAIQSELATSIASELKISLTPRAEAQLARRPTDNLAAYDLLLRYQELANSSIGTFRAYATVNEKIALLSKAVELDSKFGLAWARLGVEHANAYHHGIDNSPQRQLQAKQAMDRALQLAPEDLEVRIAEGLFHYLAYKDFARAAQSLESVLRVAPNNIDALLALSRVRSSELRSDDEAVLLEKVVALDPRNINALFRLSNTQSEFRHFDRALMLQQQIINIRPDDLELQAKYQWIEYRRTGSWNAFDKWRSTLPPGVAGSSHMVWFLDGFRANARRDLDEILRSLDAEPDATRGSSAFYIRYAGRAMALRAKGDRLRAAETARTALRRIESELQQKHDLLALLQDRSFFHAILGEREAAFSDHRRAHAMALANKNLQEAQNIYQQSLYLYAILGDKEQTLKELSRQLKLPGLSAHIFRNDVAFASFWDDPAFLSIVNDPANNAPLPFDRKDTLALQKLER